MVCVDHCGIVYPVYYDYMFYDQREVHRRCRFSFCKADDGEVIASYVRNRLWAEKKESITGTWVLTIGNDDISEISMQMENESLHMNNADGSLFKKGVHFISSLFYHVLSFSHLNI